MKSIYLIGSLRNPRVPIVAQLLRDAGYEVFDDWYAAGPEADDKWRDYEKARGHDFKTALAGHAAQHVFNFDRKHLERCDIAVLLAPSGKSAHLELGVVLGAKKPGFILLDGDPERYDVMYNFATAVFSTVEELVARLRQTPVPRVDPLQQALQHAADKLGIKIKLSRSDIYDEYNVDATLPVTKRVSIDPLVVFANRNNPAQVGDYVLRILEDLQTVLFDETARKMGELDVRRRTYRLSKDDKSALHDMFMDASEHHWRYHPHGQPTATSEKLQRYQALINKLFA